MKMDSRELTLTAIEGIPDRVPFNPFIMHLAAAVDGIDYSNVYCKNAAVLAEAQMRFADSFGIDHVHVSTDAYREASAWGVEVDFSGHTPVPKKHLTMDDFDSVEEPDLNSAIRIQNRIEAVRLLSGKVGSKQCVVGWIEAPFAEICCLFGLMEVLKMARYEDWNERVSSLISRIMSIQKEFAEMQIEAGADVIGAGDSAVSQIGPKRFEEACLESTQGLFSEIRKRVPVLYHVCGNSSAIDKDGRDMLKLVADSGSSILDIDYQVDLHAAKQKVGQSVCLRGNTNTALLGDRAYSSAEVTSKIVECVEAGKPGGRYMYSAGCEWPWEPLELATNNLRIAKKLVDREGVY